MERKERTGNAYFFVVTLTACFLLLLFSAAAFSFDGAKEESSYTITTQYPNQSAEQTASFTEEVQPAIDLNAATQSELEMLPGIGPTLAERIVQDREENGAFASVDELVRVEGIGQGKLENLRDMVTVGEGGQDEDLGGR